jgi:hypothetical protein
MPKKVGLQTTILKDGEIFLPELIEHFWERADTASEVLVIMDEWKIPHSQSSLLSLAIPQHDETELALFRVVSASQSSAVKVFLNGFTAAADGRSVSPVFCVSNLDLTQLAATNTSSTTDQHLQLIRIIPAGSITSMSNLVTAIGARNYTDLLDTPQSYSYAGFQPYINEGKTALEHLPPGGKVVYNSVAKIADYTITALDGTVRFNATSGNLNANLPAYATVAGRRFVIKNLYTSTSTVTLAPNGSELIEGRSFYRLVNPGESAVIYAGPSGWEIESIWSGL